MATRLVRRGAATAGDYVNGLPDLIEERVKMGDVRAVAHYTDFTRLARTDSVLAPLITPEARCGSDDSYRAGKGDPVSRFLPEFANLRVRGPDGTEGPASRPPTIRELMTHTAGSPTTSSTIPGSLNREARVSDGLDQPGLTTADAMHHLASVPLGYQLGTGWEYSLATDVLGAVIEKVTGASLGAFVTQSIAKPLGIQSFVFNAPETTRSHFVQVTRPSQVTGALGTGYVPVVGPEAAPFPPTKGTANFDPNRAQLRTFGSDSILMNFRVRFDVAFQGGSAG